eukprot:CAMPEP_0180144722 /NCGR_PEP_ID=MMETSP0986-20121125/17150_1 /TAXON_ID=697907 /ORGANISM="non described non described, Strain CCMP2293" /LENGTH=104 /DNA_ID=CAMNT_0022088775 /DNA_START=370 /DNA_END=683 /DNA_ORIENTATION=+
MAERKELDHVEGRSSITCREEEAPSRVGDTFAPDVGPLVVDGGGESTWVEESGEGADLVMKRVVRERDLERVVRERDHEEGGEGADLERVVRERDHEEGGEGAR